MPINLTRLSRTKQQKEYIEANKGTGSSLYESREFGTKRRGKRKKGFLGAISMAKELGDTKRAHRTSERIGRQGHEITMQGNRFTHEKDQLKTSETEKGKRQKISIFADRLRQERDITAKRKAAREGRMYDWKKTKYGAKEKRKNIKTELTGKEKLMDKSQVFTGGENVKERQLRRDLGGIRPETTLTKNLDTNVVTKSTRHSNVLSTDKQTEAPYKHQKPLSDSELESRKRKPKTAPTGKGDLTSTTSPGEGAGENMILAGQVGRYGNRKKTRGKVYGRRLYGGKKYGGRSYS